jgi:hypothetical protein
MRAWEGEDGWRRFRLKVQHWWSSALLRAAANTPPLRLLVFLRAFNDQIAAAGRTAPSSTNVVQLILPAPETIARLWMCCVCGSAELAARFARVLPVTGCFYRGRPEPIYLWQFSVPIWWVSV